MSSFDVPYPTHSKDMEHQNPEGFKSPPVYGGDGGHVRHHYYQVPVEAPRAEPWYRRKAHILAILGVTTLLLAIATAVSLAVIFTRSSNNNEYTVKATAPTAIPLETTESLEISSSKSDFLSETIEAPSVVIVTLTGSNGPTTDEATTMTRTITQSGDDPGQSVGDMISSLFSEVPYYTTQIVTVPTSTEEEPSTEQPPSAPALSTTFETSEMIASSASSLTSTSSANEIPPTSSISSKETEAPDVPSSSTETTASSSSFETTKATSRTSAGQPDASATPTSSPSSLSKTSNLAAVDVTIAPPGFQRRLVVWQDPNDELIARQSLQGQTTVYRISERIESEDDKPPAPKSGTPLTAAPDDTGSIHVFYVSDDGNKAIHLIERGEGQWTSEGEMVEVSERSSLSATWHQSEDETNVVVLAYMSPDEEICFQIAAQPLSNTWETFRPDEFNTLDIGEWDSVGLTIASGIQNPGDTMSGPSPGNYTGLHVILEGSEEVQIVECVVKQQDMTACYYAEDYFARNHEEPIPISSHPTDLSWNRLRLDDGTPPLLYGFLTLEKQQSSLLDHRVIPLSPTPDPGGAAVVYRGDMETHSVIDRDIHAIAMTDEQALFVRSGTQLFEFWLKDDAWEIFGEVDTTLSRDEGGD